MAKSDELSETHRMVAFSLLPLGLLCLSSQLGLPAFSSLLPAFLSLLPTSGVPLSSGKRLQSGELLALIVLVGGREGDPMAVLLDTLASGEVRLRLVII
jgi:hypothetical protein